MKISELYGKNIEQADGKRKGYILGITYSNCAIDGLICCDESEKTFFVAAGDISSLCGETRFIKTCKANKNTASMQLGKAVYSYSGKYRGYLEDCILNGVKITHAVVGGKKIAFNKLNMGDACIIKDDKINAERAAKDLFINAVCSTQN